MKVRVLGCHGGASLHHRTVTFLIDDRLALDAGSLAGGLTVEEQARVEAVLVTHAHLDHVSDLGTFCDTRAQQERPALVIAGIPETIDALRTHFFNDVLWPDFAQISIGAGPALVFRELALEEPIRLAELTIRPVPVDHSVPSCGFLVSDGEASLAYSGDTGPTERFWEAVNGLSDLKGVITEVSFPNRLEELARVTGHLTPATLQAQLAKLAAPGDVPVFVYGMKPLFVEEIESEMAELGSGNVRILSSMLELQL